MRFINAFSNGFCNGFMKPFELASPWPGLGAASLLLTIAVLLGFKFFSHQAELRRVKNRLWARVLEIQLFKDDLIGIFPLFGRILILTLRYMKESMKPSLILSMPIILFIIQLAGWFEHRPLSPEEETLLTVHLDARHEMLDTEVSIKTSPGLDIETEAFRLPKDHKAIWRLRARETAQNEWVEITVGEETSRKKIVVSALLKKLSTQSVRDGLWAKLIHPVEPLETTIETVALVEIDYPQRHMFLGPFRVHWIMALFILSMILGLIIKYPLRVDF